MTRSDPVGFAGGALVKAVGGPAPEARASRPGRSPVAIAVLGAVLACTPVQETESRAWADRAADSGHVAVGACPTECCAYGWWTARADLPAYAFERAHGAPTRTIRAGTLLFARRGNVYVDQVGIVEVTRSGMLDGHEPAPAYRVEPGDTIRVLEPLGDGVIRVVHRGTTLAGFAFWLLPRPEAELPEGRVLREPRIAWWSEVILPSGRAVWLDMDRVAALLDGVDACA